MRTNKVAEQAIHVIARVRAGRIELANGRHLPYQKLGVKPPRPYAPRW
jgi:hypothetical protein